MSVALKKSPLARVKDEFGGKDKLVDKILGVIDSGDESKDDLRKRLLGVANGKLVRLFSVATRTKAAGGHDKLASATAEKLKHGKDKDFVAKLGEYSDGRLLDMLSAAERAESVAAKKPAKATANPAAKKAAAAKGEKKPEKKIEKSAAKSPVKGGKKKR